MLLMTINKFCFRGSPQFGLRAADDTLILYKQFFLYKFHKIYTIIKELFTMVVFRAAGKVSEGTQEPQQRTRHASIKVF